MHASTRLLAALAAGLVLAASSARAGEPSGGLRVRLGLYGPGPGLDEDVPLRVGAFGAGPELEVGLARALAPWLEVEGSLGWGSAATPRSSTAVSANPRDPASPIVDVELSSRLHLVPLTASARLRWPEGTVRPHLLAGVGLLYARLVHAAYTTQGWGPQLRAGAGVDWHLRDRLRLGLEGWWGWGRTEMTQVSVSPQVLAVAPHGPLRSDGLHLLATAGWRY